MTTETTVFELSIQEEQYESPLDYGTYATREAAQAAADFIMANWHGEWKPRTDQVHIRERSVLKELPELHIWYCNIRLDDPTFTPQLEHMGRPSLRGIETNWRPLQDPAQFYSSPLRFIAASGQTKEVAIGRAMSRLQKALDAGALDILSRHEKVLREANARFEKVNQDPELSSWAILREIQEQVAAEEFAGFESKLVI